MGIIIKDGVQYGNQPNIYNGLDKSSTGEALDAYQGKVLDEKKLDKIDYVEFEGATNLATGKKGIVPAPDTTGKYLSSDGTWKTVDDTPTDSSQNLVTSGGVANKLNLLQSGLAIIVDGDTASMAVPVGGYAYIKGNTHGLSEGLYKNTSSAVFPASGGTADGTVFTAASGGGLNVIKQSMAIKTMVLSITTNSNGTAAIPNSAINPNTMIIVGIRTDGQGYCTSNTVINYEGALVYKIKLWDTSGATMQVDANRTSSITVYYCNL